MITQNYWNPILNWKLNQFYKEIVNWTPDPKLIVEQLNKQKFCTKKIQPQNDRTREENRFDLL